MILSHINKVKNSTAGGNLILLSLNFVVGNIYSEKYSKLRNMKKTNPAKDNKGVCQYWRRI